MISGPQQLMIAALAAGVLAAGAYFYGRHEGRALERAEWVERDNDALREANRAINAAQEKARKQEQAHAEAQAQLTVDYEKDLENAETERDRALARVRSGELRLRDATPGCTTAGGGGAETPTGAPGGAAAAAEGGLSRERDEAAVRLLAEADEVVKELNFCWAVVRADRGI